VARNIATWKQHDLEPPARTTGLQNADGTPIDITGATNVTFIMRQVGSTGASAITRTATTVDAANGIVQLAWTTGDLDVVGVYDQDWRINWPTSRPQTVPNTGHNTIVVEDDLTAG